MLHFVKVSQWIRFGFLSSEELAGFDSASACRFSKSGMYVIEKCFNNHVASRTRQA